MNKDIMVEDFVKLFSTANYEDKILAAMNKEIQQKRA